mmetsp:Transcript_58597/g.124362  ORF Transcript_58597/g.124362 Transcript_58597/m.124362 type:complete len:281 (-) Transcript_58597:1232-2074(-)
MTTSARSARARAPRMRWSRKRLISAMTRLMLICCSPLIARGRRSPMWARRVRMRRMPATMKGGAMATNICHWMIKGATRNQRRKKRKMMLLLGAQRGGTRTLKIPTAMMSLTRNPTLMRGRESRRRASPSSTVPTAIRSCGGTATRRTLCQSGSTRGDCASGSSARPASRRGRTGRRSVWPDGNKKVTPVESLRRRRRGGTPPPPPRKAAMMTMTDTGTTSPRTFWNPTHPSSQRPQRDDRSPPLSWTWCAPATEISPTPTTLSYRPSNSTRGPTRTSRC